jgi:hypothetical protein
MSLHAMQDAVTTGYLDFIQPYCLYKFQRLTRVFDEQVSFTAVLLHERRRKDA